MDKSGENVTGEVTNLLRAWAKGELAASDQLLPIIYGELHRLASFHMRNERRDHTWSPTELISEAYLRLIGGAELEFADRAHFFAIASRSMRQILVDHARSRGASKRGAGVRPVELDETRIAAARPWDIIMVDEALEKLAKFDERKARVTELYYFGGLTQEQIAAACNVHVNTVARDLQFSAAWFREHLDDNG
jgi:RNA polymerase sigma-70 factor, ECF subfamily